MKSALRKIRPQSIEELAAVISLYRPGPMQFIPKYAENKRNPEKTSYLHPVMEPILKDTFGCIVYQEQVMRIFQDIAGYSLGKADIIRRAMSKKKKSLLDAERELFIRGARERGTDEPTACAVWNELCGFASYAFNKSHAAAYAILAYQTAFFKARFPSVYIFFLDSDEREETALDGGSGEKIYVNTPDLDKCAAVLKNLTAGQRKNGNTCEVYLCCQRKVYDSGVKIRNPAAWRELFSRVFGIENVR
jgi:DNA polymerase III alpha subunit